jgi:tripartite-type tricarboxylate transporter receptor subunit TctC
MEDNTVLLGGVPGPRDAAKVRELILKRIFALLGILGCVAALPSATRAQSTFPNHPVKVICGFPAGSSLDIVTRVASRSLEEGMGQPFVVENRAGATGNLAAEFVARSPADGYTLLTGGSSQAISMSAFQKLNFNIEADFEPVALIANMPMILVVNSSLGVNSVAELIALAKSKPGELTFGSPGVGSIPHMSAELFNLMAGVKITHVPYRGTNQVLVDLISGRLSMMFAPAPTLAGQHDNPNLKILAVSSQAESDLVPGVKPLNKLGLPNFETTLWNAIWAPKGTPKAIVSALNRVVVTASETPAVKKMLADNGVDPMPDNEDQVAQFISDDVKKWKKVVDFAGIKME